MVVAAILAGGIGSRMGRGDLPKQFLSMDGKPILFHTVKKFTEHERIDKVLVLCPKERLSDAEEILRPLNKEKKISVLSGGKTRNETLLKALRYIEETYGLSEDTVLLTHDSVRPFVTERIISDNIEAVLRFGACTTAIPVTDTIAESTDGEFLSKIPDRSLLYQVQTPQSFFAKRLFELCTSLSEEEKTVLTDAAKIYRMKGETVYIVRGEVSNIKITYPTDLSFAEALLKEEKIS